MNASFMIGCSAVRLLAVRSSSHGSRPGAACRPVRRANDARTAGTRSLGSDLDARVDDPAAGAGRKSDDRIQVQLRNFRNTLGKMRDSKQDLPQGVDVGGRTPAKTG